MNAIEVTAMRLPDPALTNPGQTKDPAKIRDAAQQFEALLLGQILRSARENGGWMGSGSDSSAELRHLVRGAAPGEPAGAAGRPRSVRSHREGLQRER
jgi:hypothetical protein